MPVSEGEDVRQKRQDCVKVLRQALSDFEGEYAVHEGFREVFLEAKGAQRPAMLKKVFGLLRKGQLKEVGTLGSFFDWQKERVIRDDRKNAEKTHNERNSQFNRRPNPRNREESEESASSSGEVQERQERGDWKKRK